MLQVASCGISCTLQVDLGMCALSSVPSGWLQEYEFDLEVTPADAEGNGAEAMEEA